MGRQLQVSFGSSTDNVKVVGYRLFRDGTAIATIDGLSFKQLLTLGKPGKLCASAAGLRRRRQPERPAAF